MVAEFSIKNLSKPVLDVEKFPYLIGELNEQDQEAISGGGLQRLQEEFAAELAILGAMALPSLLNRHLSYLLQRSRRFLPFLVPL